MDLPSNCHKYSPRLDLGFLVSGFWFLVSSFGLRVSGFGFRVSGFGFLVSGSMVSVFGFLASGSMVSGFGFRVSGFRFRVSGFGFQVWDFGFRDSGENMILSSIGRSPASEWRKRRTRCLTSFISASISSGVRATYSRKGSGLSQLFA